MLDKPLTGPQIKYWLRDHRKIVDLAIYTSNQINYTANPVFNDGIIDPVLACGEERFGILDLDDALVDEVIVPEEIATYIPTHIGVACTTRPATISEPKRQTLLAEADACDEPEGNRHGTVARWVFDAYGCGMDEQEITDTAVRTLERLGRPSEKAPGEVARLIVGAQRKLADGTLTISAHLNASADFDPVDTDDNQPAALTPAQAQAQNNALIPWYNRLKVSPSNGAFKSSIDNAAIILHNHSSFQLADGGCILAYDSFRGVPVWTAPPPWWRSLPEKARPAIGSLGAPVTDADAIACAVWLGHLDPASGPEGTPIHISKSLAIDAMVHVSRYRTVNPVVEYLDQCAEKWDGKQRLDSVLTDVCHAKRADIVPAWFRKWMIQGVARAYRPGAKCDGVLVFQGGQGAKKSTFFRHLCPFEELFFEGTINFRDKDSMQEIQGKFIVELSEMSGTKKDVDVLKSYITKQDDTYRASYGHQTERHPRTMIFCGTTNDDESLVDTSGRRWWMVAIPDSDGTARTQIDLARARSERDLWWGEAVHAFRKNEEWWLDFTEDERTREIATWHSMGLETTAEIAAWLDTPKDRGGPAHPDVVRVIDIWTGPLCKPKGNWHSGSGREVARVMSAVKGWARVRLRLTPSLETKLYVRKGSKFHLDNRALKDYISHHQPTSSASDDFSADTPAA
jgi:hypothetical protein